MIIVDIRTHTGKDKAVVRVVLPDGSPSGTPETVLEPDGQTTIILEDDEVIEVERYDD